MSERGPHYFFASWADPLFLSFLSSDTLLEDVLAQRHHKRTEIVENYKRPMSVKYFIKLIKIFQQKNLKYVHET